MSGVGTSSASLTVRRTVESGALVLQVDPPVTPTFQTATILHGRLPTVHYVLVPQTAETRGHGNHTWVRFWKQWVVDLLRRTE